jgi:hypothetical protein
MKKAKVIVMLVVILIASLTGSTTASVIPGGTDHVERNLSAVENGLGPTPFFNHQGPGADFIKAGVSTRVFYGSAPGTPQVEPFVLIVPALPAGAVVVETFISWNYLLNGTPPATDVITVNGNPLTGTLVGTGSPDLCWGKDGAASYMISGVTSFVNPGPAPVNVTIGGATDKPLGSDGNAYGEGLTILVVYKVPSQPWRNVDLYRGYTSNQSNPAGPAAATLNYTVAYNGGDFHFFLNALDGQQIYSEDFFVDGINRSGQVNGTVAVGNAWQGLLGPPGPGVNNLYDHANDNISAFLPTPDVSLDISTNIISDCIGHSFAAISFPAEHAAIPTLTEWGLIIFGVVLLGFITWVFLRRRREAVSLQ